MRPFLAVDANLFVLLVVGATTTDYIPKHKRLRDHFSAKDYGLLRETVFASAGVVVTPHILAETSNLLGYITEPARSEILSAFKEIIAKVQERHIESIRAAGRNEFLRLGLPDAGLLELCRDGAMLITCDTDLWLAALDNGMKALHFDHLRNQ